MYSKEALERFKNPKNAGNLDNADVVGEVGNLKCGDIIQVSLKVKDNVIEDIKFKTYGCVAAIAASDMLCELAKGKTLDEAMKIEAKDVFEKVGKMPNIKFHCSMMGIDALKKAIKKYKEKKK